MTAYFDAFQTKLHEQRAKIALDAAGEEVFDNAIYNALLGLERDIVRDVTLCAEWSGCPVDVRDVIHKTVLRYAPNAQPVGCVPQCPDYEDMRATIDGLSRMGEDLHSIFHDVPVYAQGRTAVSAVASESRDQRLVAGAVLDRLIEDARTGNRDAIEELRAWDAFLNNATLDVMMALRGSKNKKRKDG